MSIDLSPGADLEYHFLQLRFKPKPDRVDSYRILDLKNPEGDCADYCITTAYIYSGNSVLNMLWNIATGKIELQTGTVSWSGERHMRVKIEGLPQPVCNLGKGAFDAPASWYKQDGKRGVIRTIIKLAIGKVFP